MGIMSLFRKRSPEEIRHEIAGAIVASSLLYRKQLEEPDPQRTWYAGAEVLYLLLHVVDKTSFRIFGGIAGQNAAEIFDIENVAQLHYAHALLGPTVADDAAISLAMKMADDMKDRQSTYDLCQSVTGDPWPSRGTMVFACGYFIHRALGRTDRTDVDAILRGEQDVTDAERGAFPDMEQSLKLAAHIGVSLAELQLSKRLERLR